MKTHLSSATLLVLCLYLACIPAFAAGGEQAAPSASGIHRFPNDPNVWVDRTKHQVFIKAQLSPDLTTVYSVLEFLLVAGQYNAQEKQWFYEKGYESAFVTKADPNNIHLALLLAGLRPGPLKASVPKGLSKGTMGGEFGARLSETDEGKREKKATAPMLDIIVRWKEGEKECSKRVEHFLFDRGRKTTAADTPWAFTGSYIATTDGGKKVLAASLSRIVISTFFDESAIVNLPYYTFNPYSSAGGLEVNAFHLPPYFTREKEIVEGYKTRKIKVPVHRHVLLVISPSKLPAPDPQQRLKRMPGAKTENKDQPDKPAAGTGDKRKDNPAAGEIDCKKP